MREIKSIKGVLVGELMTHKDIKRLAVQAFPQALSIKPSPIAPE